MLESVVFYPTAVIIVLFALFAVFARKVIYSLLSAICVFFLVGLIFYLLKAEYNAVIQLAIYGLAVPILLAFALMVTNTRVEVSAVTANLRRYLSYCAIGLITLSLVYLILISFNVFGTDIFSLAQSSVNSIRVFDAITTGFLDSYVVAFELMSLLILAVVVGVVDNAK